MARIKGGTHAAARKPAAGGDVPPKAKKATKATGFSPVQAPQKRAAAAADTQAKRSKSAKPSWASEDIGGVVGLDYGYMIPPGKGQNWYPAKILKYEEGHVTAGGARFQHALQVRLYDTTAGDSPPESGSVAIQLSHGHDASVQWLDYDAELKEERLVLLHRLPTRVTAKEIDPDGHVQLNDISSLRNGGRPAAADSGGSAKLILRPTVRVGPDPAGGGGRQKKPAADSASGSGGGRVEPSPSIDEAAMWDAWEKRFDKLKTDAVAIMGRYRTAAIAAVPAQRMGESEKGEAEKKYKLLEEKYNQAKDAAAATEVKRAALEVQVKQLCADQHATAAEATVDAEETGEGDGEGVADAETTADAQAAGDAEDAGKDNGAVDAAAAAEGEGEGEDEGERGGGGAAAETSDDAAGAAAAEAAAAVKDPQM